MPDLESEESAAQKSDETHPQSARDVKMLTTNQMLSRRPIDVAQVRTKNKSQKSKK